MVKYLINFNSKAFLILCATILFSSCENDFLELGGNLVDDVNYTNDSLVLPVTSYNQSFITDNGVQTNNLGSGALGIYNDPIYGQTTASTLSQLNITPANPTVGDSAVVDRVVVTLPYYSTALAPTAEGGTEYRLDSVYGSSAMNITAYRSNYFLSDADPQNISQNAIYYSNQIEQFNGIRGDTLFTIPQFVPSNAEIVETIPPQPNSTDTTNTIQRSAPALRVNLDSEETRTYWKSVLLDRAGSDVLFNQNSFKNYFRGVYLEAEPVSNNQGSYFLFNRAEANIQIYYTSTASSGNRSQSVITLSMNPSGQIAAIGYENDFNPSIVSTLSQPDIENGDEKLYLKGGQGSMAVIDLFGDDLDGNGIPDGLDDLRSRDISIIQEANLTFYIDQETINQLGGEEFLQPERLFVYNLETNQPLADYTGDAIRQSATGPIIGIGNNHLEPVTRAPNGEGIYYKIRITQHMRNLLNPDNDSPGTKLGVVVAEDFLPQSITTNAILNPGTNNIPNRLPLTTILSPKGTVLYGNAEADPEKRLSLELFYIQTPNQ